ncbi:transcriptional regulator [Clostridia bacterium]|nr:transcriptional regulator [Clostridia bacterium]
MSVLKNSNNKKKSLLSTYLRVVLGVVGVFVVVLAIGMTVYSRTSKPKAPTPTQVVNVPEGAAQPTSAPKSGNIITDISQIPDKTNFLIVGTDQNQLLTDVILVGSFDKNANTFTLLSVPRDTYTKMSAEDISTLRAVGRHVPESGIMKINAVHSYAGKDNGILYTKKQIETLLGVSIDYYAELNLAAFRNIVDAVGGIDMEVPKGGLYYDDPYQTPPLHIAVPGGMQHLDGKLAEGVVRYRHTYPRGDVQRIEVQQVFLKEFFSQVFNKDTIMNNAPTLISTMITYTKTNFPVTDVPKYIKYLKNIKADNIITETLPGDQKTINGASYYILDDAGVKEMVNDIFYTSKTAEPEEELPPTPEPEKKTADIKKMKIQILNGTNTKGLATEKSDMLKGYGFNVINVGNYYGNQQQKTRIIVKNSGDYTTIASLFKEAAVTSDDTADMDKYDIVIILGTSE